MAEEEREKHNIYYVAPKMENRYIDKYKIFVFRRLISVRREERREKNEVNREKVKNWR